MAEQHMKLCVVLVAIRANALYNVLCIGVFYLRLSTAGELFLGIEQKNKALNCFSVKFI